MPHPAAAFRANPIMSASSASGSNFGIKQSSGQKIIDGFGTSPSFRALVISAVLANVPPVTSHPVNVVAIRKVRLGVRAVNLSTYTYKIRLSWWKARTNVAVDAWGSTFGTMLTNMTAENDQPVGTSALNPNDISFNLFNVPIFTQHFKCYRMKKPFMLGPNKGFYAGVSMKRPHNAFTSTNADSSALLFSNMGGVKDRFCVMEVIGQFVNDRGSWPSTQFTTSPIILGMQSFAAYEACLVPNSSVYTSGDPSPPAVDALNILDPSNYAVALGNAGTGALVGQSTVAGALSSTGL